MPVDLTRRRVSIEEAMLLAGVSRRTIYNWLNAGKLEYIRTAGGAVRIFEESLFQQDTGPRRPRGERP